MQFNPIETAPLREVVLLKLGDTVCAGMRLEPVPEYGIDESFYALLPVLYGINTGPVRLPDGWAPLVLASNARLTGLRREDE